MRERKCVSDYATKECVVKDNNDCAEEYSSGGGRTSDIVRLSCRSYHSLGLLNVEGGIATND